MHIIGSCMPSEYGFVRSVLTQLGASVEYIPSNGKRLIRAMRLDRETNADDIEAMKEILNTIKEVFEINRRVKPTPGFVVRASDYPEVDWPAIVPE